jgi:hypothetical protein
VINSTCEEKIAASAGIPQDEPVWAAALKPERCKALTSYVSTATVDKLAQESLESTHAATKVAELETSIRMFCVRSKHAPCCSRLQGQLHCL